MEHSSEARVDVVEKETEKESRNISVLIWIGTFFLTFIPGLIAYFLTKDPFVKDHAKEALNMSVMIMAGYLVGALTAVFLIGFLILLLVSLYFLIFSIKGAMKAYRGESFRAPFLFRVIR